MAAITWDDNKHTDAWLQYGIRCSGITLTIIDTVIAANYAPGPYVRIKAINSKGKTTPGYIMIPIDKIPDIVDTLTKIRNEHNNCN
jgi:hypothetical protein